MNKKSVIFYIAATYVLFLLSILIAGLVMIVSKNPLVSKIAVIPCSWTPTVVLFVMLKKLCPGVTRKQYIKNLFCEALNIRLLLVLMLIQAMCFVISLLCVSRGLGVSENITISLNIILINFINSALTGATGEEAGWRGYLHPILTRRFGVIRGSAILGVIWGFWHAPLWFLTLGYSGFDLVKYIVFFLIFIISAAVLIGICYEKNRNIVIPVGIHFFINFAMSFYTGDVIRIITVMAPLYVVVAAGSIIWWKKTVARQERIS